MLQTMLSLVTSTLWLVGTYQYYATTGFKPNWSATPLFWMLTVMVSPAICFAIGLILVDARKCSELSPLGWCALAAATLPVTVGTALALWSVKVLFLMVGAGS